MLRYAYSHLTRVYHVRNYMDGSRLSRAYSGYLTSVQKTVIGLHNLT